MGAAAPLSDEERERARALPAFVVWYEDRFGSRDERDPPFPRGVYLTRDEADAEAARLGGPPGAGGDAGKFDGYTVERYDSLLAAHELRAAGSEEVRALLARR
jgi:hypothetical protein